MKIPFKKTYYKTIKAAIDMEVDVSFAIDCRIRYLSEVLDEYRIAAFFSNNETTETAIRLWSKKCNEEIDYLKERKDMSQPKKKDFDSIDDFDIDRAKEFPIDSVIEFKNRKATAWCHDDKDPSLMHLTRINKAKCYPCGKYFNPIDAYMHIHGVGFVDAVKALR